MYIGNKVSYVIIIILIHFTELLNLQIHCLIGISNTW